MNAPHRRPGETVLQTSVSRTGREGSAAIAPGNASLWSWLDGSIDVQILRLHRKLQFAARYRSRAGVGYVLHLGWNPLGLRQHRGRHCYRCNAFTVAGDIHVTPVLLTFPPQSRSCELSKARIRSLGSRAMHPDRSGPGLAVQAAGKFEDGSNVELRSDDKKRPTGPHVGSSWSSALLWMMDGFAACALAHYAAAADPQHRPRVQPMHRRRTPDAGSTGQTADQPSLPARVPRILRRLRRPLASNRRL